MDSEGKIHERIAILGVLTTSLKVKKCFSIKTLVNVGGRLLILRVLKRKCLCASETFSESLRNKLFARFPFFEIQMASILSTVSGPVKTASEGLAISLSLQLGLRVGNAGILGV